MYNEVLQILHEAHNISVSFLTKLLSVKYFVEDTLETNKLLVN